MKLKLHLRKQNFSNPHTHTQLSILSFSQGKQERIDCKETPDLLHAYFTFKKVIFPEWRIIQKEARY
jgi:hypothetical protein